jgi:hypothetical protein
MSSISRHELFLNYCARVLGSTFIQRNGRSDRTMGEPSIADYYPALTLFFLVPQRLVTQRYGVALSGAA